MRVLSAASGIAAASLALHPGCCRRTLSAGRRAYARISWALPSRQAREQFGRFRLLAAVADLAAAEAGVVAAVVAVRLLVMMGWLISLA